MALGYTWRQFVQRLNNHINNDYPGTDFTITENLMLLYINEAMSYGLVGQVWNNAKNLGQMEVPDGYIVKFQLAALTQDSVSGKWLTALPQPPLSLPLGYSVNRVYPATAGLGEGYDVIFLKSKRIGRRKRMPLQFGVYGEFYNSVLRLWESDGGSLLNQVFYAEMPSTRAVSITDAINLPDDAQKIIFDLVIARLKDRLGIPQDIIQDDLPAGRKDS